MRRSDDNASGKFLGWFFWGGNFFLGGFYLRAGFLRSWTKGMEMADEIVWEIVGLFFGGEIFLGGLGSQKTVRGEFGGREKQMGEQLDEIQ
jgi:hypothetical protein